jgi:hypothetical protein
VEWQTLLEGALGSSPIALVLGFATWSLWGKNREQEKEIQRLNEARIADLKAIAERDD